MYTSLLGRVKRAIVSQPYSSLKNGFRGADLDCMIDKELSGLKFT